MRRPRARIGTVRPRATLLTGVIGAIILMTAVFTAWQSGSLLDFSGWTLIRDGSNFAPLSLHGQEWGRLLASAWLHGGILHLAFNLWALSVVGPLFEPFFGRWLFALVYVASALGGSLASAVLTDGNSVGASGAIVGITGAGAMAGHLMGSPQGRALRDQFLFWFGINLLIGFAPAPGGARIDNWAHIGGFLTGAAVTWGLFRLAGDERHRRTLAALRALGAVSFLVFVLALPLQLWRARDLPHNIGGTEQELRIAGLQAWEPCRDAVRRNVDAGPACARWAGVEVANPLAHLLVAAVAAVQGDPGEARRRHRIASALAGGALPEPTGLTRDDLLQLTDELDAALHAPRPARR